MKSFQNNSWPKLAVSLGLAFFLFNPTPADGKPGQAITLDGEDIKVFWNDGDSFRIRSRSHKGLKVRLVGFNTLENHGPVHRWGRWEPKDLLRIAYQARDVARGYKWTCNKIIKDGKPALDGYGRSLLQCDDLAKELVAAGLAHVFLFDPGASEPELLALQQQAQKDGVGMWALGVPDAILTSLHSGDEKTDSDYVPYNRVANARTGLMQKIEHDKTYQECEEVCAQGSCQLYVPYKRRYGDNKAPCLEYKR